MAKNLAPSGRSKVRVLFLEADVAGGDIKELTTALAAALRPTVTLQRIEAGTPVASTNPTSTVIDEPVEAPANPEDVDVAQEQEENQGGASRQRKYRSPRPVVDLAMNAGGKPFSDFGAEKAPTNDAMRYLVAAAWLAEQASTPTITVDHVYTCYKSAGWTYEVSDPGSPFRYLKQEGLGDTKAGKFTVNHLGLAKVQKMKPTHP